MTGYYDVGFDEPIDCEDGNLCTIDHFDNKTASCVHENVICPKGKFCNPASGLCVKPKPKLKYSKP